MRDAVFTQEIFPERAVVEPLWNFSSTSLHSYYIELTLSALENAVRPLTYPPAVSVISLVNDIASLNGMHPSTNVSG